MLLGVVKRPSSSSFTSSPGVRSSRRDTSPSSPPLSSAHGPWDQSRSHPSPAGVQDRARAAASRPAGNRIFSPLCPEAMIWFLNQGFLKQLLTGCTRWIYPLNPTTFHVLINNANIFCDSYPPNIFSLGCPSATAQAREGSYRSVQITMLRPCAMAGRAGRFLCYSFSHHRSARGPGESAASRLKGSFGNGPGPCQVWQLPPQL